VTDDYVIAEEHYDASEVVAIPMEPGSGLFFHSLLMHATAENRSATTRRAITMSYMAAEYRYVKRSSAGVGERPQPEYMRVSGVDVPGGV
jgi:ectoine hydroxylase-related dioxygenase (phytanoyl-CoA dioxygenase family)